MERNKLFNLTAKELLLLGFLHKSNEVQGVSILLGVDEIRS